jgi:Flp pilus assembly protein CpaB
LREWHRLGHRYRRWLAATLAGGSALLIISANEPEPLPRLEVYMAARDLPAGTRLQPGDLALKPLASSTIPSGALTAASAPIGRVLAAPVREGEAITDVRVIGPGLLEQQQGLVAAPVRISDAAAVRLLSVGDVVSVLAAGGGPMNRHSAGGSGAARVVTPAARVLTLPTPLPGDGAGVAGGALIVLAVTPRTATELAAAAVTDALSVVLRTP